MIHIFLIVLFCAHTTEINTTHEKGHTVISDRIIYLKKLLTNNLKVLKDIIPIDEDTLWCTPPTSNSAEGPQQTLMFEEEQVTHDTCPVQKNEKLPVCNKYDENEHAIQTRNKDDSSVNRAPSDTGPAETKYELDFALLIREYEEMKVQCKDASIGLQQKCKELDANMQKLFKLHDTLQELKSREIHLMQT